MSEISKMCIGLHGKYPLFLSSFNDTSNCLDRVLKNLQISNFMMRNCPVGAELFHADGWTDTMNVIVVLRNFANAPKN